MFKKYEQIIFKEASYEDEAYVFDEADDVFFSEELGSMPEGVIGEILVEEDDTDLDMTLEEALGPMAEGDKSFGALADELNDMDDDVTKLIKDHGDTTVGEFIAGSDLRTTDLDSDKEEKETDYANDGDLSKFMDYIKEQYPSKIPQHDGRTTVGCERALSFLDRINGDISKAIRGDHDGLLDIQALEDIRLNIIRDISVLKSHLGKLKQMAKDQHEKEATAKIAPTWITATGSDESLDGLRKEAGTPNNVVISITPFERAIVGMMINAHVSAGHPIEVVYDALKKKYKLTDREELAIMQIAMDSGFHIFRDRGASKASDSDKVDGIDFMKNYFA